MHTFTAIIPALNEALLIGHAIASAWAAGAQEVIVVDGGSIDETLSAATDQGATVLAAARGRAAQQNAGAEAATGDFLLFLHADTWLDPACRAQLASVMSDPRCGVAAFRQQIDGEGRLYRLLEWGNAARVRWRGMAYGDQGIVIRRTLFLEAGGFPDVPLMEDLLLMRRLHVHGPVRLLDGPLHVSSRRWREHGVIRQTLRNWSLLAAERCGVPLDRLAQWYRPNIPRQDALAIPPQTTPMR